MFVPFDMFSRQTQSKRLGPDLKSSFLFKPAYGKTYSLFYCQFSSEPMADMFHVKQPGAPAEHVITYSWTHLLSWNQFCNNLTYRTLYKNHSSENKSILRIMSYLIFASSDLQYKAMRKIFSNKWFVKFDILSRNSFLINIIALLQTSSVMFHVKH